MGELRGKFSFFGDVAFGTNEVQRLSVLIAGRRTRHLGNDDLAVLAQVALDVADLVGAVRDQAFVRLLREFDVLGVGDLGRVTAEQFLA